MPETPTILILAAGAERRFGAQGRNLAQAMGRRTVLGVTIQHALATGWPVSVVLTAALAPLAASSLATRDLVVLDEPAAARGIGHVIAAAVSANADSPGWLLLPGDMPLVRPSSMRAVGHALAAFPVAYAQHHGRPGHPQGFAPELFSELMALPAEEGTRRLLARYPAAGVELDDPGVLLDVAAGHDLAAVRAALEAAEASAEFSAQGAQSAEGGAGSEDRR